MKNILIILTLSLFFIACEKDITVDLPKTELKYVVEGYIEEGQHPYIILTKNSSYYEPISLSDLNDLAVIDAEVIVSDGTTTEILQLVFDTLSRPNYKYVGNTIIGEKGKTYTLEIKVNGKVLTSKTTIPNSVQIDSLKFKLENMPGDTLGLIWFYFNDPDTLGNYYRMSTKVIGQDPVFYYPFSSVSDDKLVNGRQAVPFSIYRAHGAFEEINAQEFYKWYFTFGNSVVFKFTTMEASTYQFWYTYELIRSSGGPYATPITLKSNIDGGVGIWGGYGVSLDTISISN